MFQVNVLAIFAAVVSNLVIGFLWYSPFLFGGLWVQLRELKPEDMKESKPALLGTFAAAIVSAYVLGIMMNFVEAENSTQGAITGFLISLCIAAAIGTNYLFENGKLKLYFLTVGYHLAAFIAMGAVLGIWM